MIYVKLIAVPQSMSFMREAKAAGAADFWSAEPVETHLVLGAKPGVDDHIQVRDQDWIVHRVTLIHNEQGVTVHARFNGVIEQAAT